MSLCLTPFHSPKHQQITRAIAVKVNQLGKLNALSKSKGINTNTLVNQVPVTTSKAIKINGGIILDFYFIYKVVPTSFFDLKH